MLKNKGFKKSLSLLLSFSLTLGFFTTVVQAETTQVSSMKVDLKEVAAKKLAPEVKKDMDTKDLVEVLVYMKEQVDTEKVATATRSALSLETSYETKLQVRRAVVEALRDQSDRTQRNVIKFLAQEKEKGTVKEFTSYDIVNMIYVKADKKVIENISFMSEVEKIYKNKTHELDYPEKSKQITPSKDELEWNIERVRADATWDLGFDGTGIVVASLDSGIDWTHPALKNKWRGYDVATGETNPAGNWFDPVYNSTLPADSDSHGTHVMGTMVGQEEDGKNKVGVAPGAKWIAARVFNTEGSTTDAILLSAADWIIAPNGNSDLAPDVVNNSWGGGDGIDDWYREAVVNWREAGIVPVFSAGNQRQGEPAPYPGSISVPSNYPESFAVAAVDSNDVRGSFSKLGPSPYDESLIKPDISGPGVGIRSSVPGGGYESGWSGTSMSAPAVSGVIALLLQANSSLTVSEVEEILKETADRLTDDDYPTAPNMAYGYGMVNAFEAVAKVASGLGTASGSVFIPGEDTQEPVIMHEQNKFKTYAGANIDIVANISDDVSIIDVELLVKIDNQSDWIKVPMNLIAGDFKTGTYKGTITPDMLVGESVTYKIKVNDFAENEVVTEDYTIDVVFGILPDEDVYDFEDHANGWTFNGSWQWGVPSGNSPEAYQGNGLAGTNISGNYPNSEDAWLIAPPIDLRDSSLELATFRFYEWYDLENNWDKGYLMVSADNGETWQELRPSITGDGTMWKESVINLGPYIGSTNPIFIGFRFTSDSSGVRPGWFIDQVALVSEDTEAPSAPTNLKAEAMIDAALSWNPSPEGDLANYNVYRSEVSDRDYSKISSPTSPSTLDKNIEAGKTYYYKVTAEDFSGNESEYSEEVSVIAPVVEVIYEEDFEADDGGFITGTTEDERPNDWQWGPPTSGPNEALTGNNVWATNLSGLYLGNHRGYIESPDIEIPQDLDATMVFDYWMDSEQFGTGTIWDYGNVQVSTDEGKTWAVLTGKIGGHHKKWENKNIDLSAYSGQTIKVRFFFYSDFSGHFDGWYIDNILIAGVESQQEEPLIGEEIKYDDGTAENALVLNEINNGLAVRFTPERAGKVIGANVYFWGLDFPEPGGTRIGFAIYNQNQEQIGETIYQDVVRASWNEIELSELNFSTGDDFYISTVQDVVGDSSPAVGIDEDSAHGDRSYLNVEGDLSLISSEGVDGGLMIRAIVAYETGEENSIPPIIKPNQFDKKSNRSMDSISYQLFSDKTEEKKELKEDFVEPSVPKYGLEKDHADKLDKYETISDNEVQNLPLALAGIPAQNAVVTVLETGRTVRVDPATGKYFIREAVGVYTLKAEAYGYQPKEETIEIKEDQDTETNFLLDPKQRGSIEGQVVDRYDDTPAAYATIRLAEDPNVAPVTADAEGRFTIENVLEGEYTLKVTADGFKSGQATVEVKANEKTTVEIRLERFVGYQDEIIYDDGTAENALVLNGANNGLAVRFTPDQFGKVKAANVFFWGTNFPTPGGNRIGFLIYDENQKQIGEPLFQDVVRGDWNLIDLSEFAFETGKDFYISTMQDKPGDQCPAVGIDEDSAYASRSYMNVAGEFNLISSEEIAGGLMIRAIMEYAMETPIITRPEAITYTKEDSIMVEGITTADGTINVYVNDEKVKSVQAEDKKFAVDVNLPADENEIKVTAEIDGRETEPSKAVMVIKDKEAPVLIVEEPLNDSKINVEVVTVKGQATDNLNLETVEINGEPVEVDGEGHFNKKLILEVGENTISILAKDRAGNETSEELMVYVNLDAPTITEMEPSSDIVVKAGDEVEVSFKSNVTGGQAYFEISLPISLQDLSELQNPMVEVEDGFYKASWIVPEELVLKNGLVEFMLIDGHGNAATAIAPGTVTIEAEVVVKPGTVERVFGNDRYQTSVEISKKMYDKSDLVVLASGINFPDALAGSPLASVKDAPMLLVANNIPNSVLEEIERLEAKKIILLGGTIAINDLIKAELEALGYIVERVAGENRFATAVEIGNRVVESTNSKTAMLVSGFNFPDALGVNSAAGRDGNPVLFTSKDSLPVETIAALADWDIKEVHIVGGLNVISQEVEEELEDLGYTVNRISSDNRFLTALEVAKELFDKPETVIVTNGTNYPDALAGGPLATKLDAPILLVTKDEVLNEVLGYLRDEGIKTVIVLGGELAISKTVVVRIETVINEVD